MRLKDYTYSNSQMLAIARLFSASVVRDFSRDGRSALFTRLATEANLFRLYAENEPISELFENAYSVLKRKNNRHEYVYKSAITHKVLLGKHSLNTASMVNEFRVGECKADTVILNGTGAVYEIKSERDTLSRLTKQITVYREVFAKVNVITGENHLDSVHSCVPDDVGIMVLSDRHRISTIREAIDQPERTNPVVIFESIQLREAKALLKLLKIQIPDLPNTKMHSELREIFSRLDPVETHMAMVTILKKTRSLVSLSHAVGTVPDSLLSAVFSTKVRKSDFKNIIKAVKTPIEEAIRWN
ncbi:sce7726 family protein [Paremcibacter congregatus]|mgnify:CR=1 FL=1|uniref:sce7726 family protein n=1 Tax=Paremcibacter congregatus TaxID=2043170 RepID=UPI0030EF23E4